MPTTVLPLEQIAPDPEQPRRRIDEAELDSLAWSMAAHGLLHPIHVTRPPEDNSARPFVLLVGERRFLAARKLRWTTIPVFIHEPMAPADRTMVQLEENDLRVPLSLLDRALAVARALERSGLSQAEFARRNNKTMSAVSKLLWITRSEGLTRQALEDNLLAGIEVARAFASLPARHQAHLVERARRNGDRITDTTVQRVRLTETDTAAPEPSPRSDKTTVLLELTLDQLHTLLVRLGLTPPVDPEAGRLELLRQLA